MKNKKKKLEPGLDFWFQVRRDIVKLANIMRDIKYQSVCQDSNHALRFCTDCNKSPTDAVRRIKKYEAESK